MDVLSALAMVAGAATTPTPTPTSPTVTAAAVLTLVGVLAGALIAGGFRLRGDRVARLAESQRTALYELQGAALTLRKALRKYGEAGPRPLAYLEEAVDEANGRYQVHVERVICEQVRDPAWTWREVGERFWTGDATVPIHTEEQAWKNLQMHIGTELRRLDS